MKGVEVETCDTLGLLPASYKAMQRIPTCTIASWRMQAITTLADTLTGALTKASLARPHLPFALLFKTCCWCFNPCMVPCGLYSRHPLRMNFPAVQGDWGLGC